MSIRTVPYRAEIIGGIASLLSLDASDLQEDTAATWARRINSWTRKGFNYWGFKELELTEERAYRQVWNAALGYRATIDEVFYLPTASYYQAAAGTAPGESPESTPAKWSPLTIFDRTIAFEQYGKQSIGKIISVNTFDPTKYRSAWTGRRNFTLNGRGIRPTTYGFNTVWLTYQPRAPQFASEVYDPAKLYLRDALIYDPTTGESFRALRDSQGQEPASSGSYWFMQQMPYVLSEYVQSGVAGDLAEDAQTKAYCAAQAEEAIIGEINNEIQQGVRASYSLLDQEAYDCRCGWSVQAALIQICAA